jgi:hypothetical protein
LSSPSALFFARRIRKLVSQQRLTSGCAPAKTELVSGSID